jgi:succinoglycan biosynthesis protein ExoA
MNYRIRSTGGLVWFSPELSVSYRPRSSLRAMANQYFHYGRWRRQVIRAHPGSVNFRYLAPPLALLGVVAGLVLSTFLTPLALTVPAAYLLLVVAGSLVIGRRLPPGALAVLPVVITTMHMTWGAGFLSSWRSVAQG